MTHENSSYLGHKSKTNMHISAKMKFLQGQGAERVLRPSVQLTLVCLK